MVVVCATREWREKAQHEGMISEQVHLHATIFNPFPMGTVWENCRVFRMTSYAQRPVDCDGDAMLRVQGVNKHAMALISLHKHLHPAHHSVRLQISYRNKRQLLPHGQLNLSTAPAALSTHSPGLPATSSPLTHPPRSTYRPCHVPGLIKSARL